MNFPTSFSDLATLCQHLEGTTKKLEKGALISNFLRGLQPDEIASAVLLLLGRIFSATDARTLNVSWRTLQNVEAQARKGNGKKPPLSILEVHQHFAEIAGASGKGSRQRKEELLADLLSRVAPIEKKYLVKMIFGEMQHGAAEGVMQQGVAAAIGVDLALVRRAALLLGDIATVARLGLVEGKAALESITLQLMRPIQPMLAELGEDFEKVFQEHGGQTALEYKYDGARVQIHCSHQSGEVKIFTRHLSEVTASLPEITDWMKTKIKADSFIVEGEVVAVNAEGKPLPFQELMRRFRRIRQIEQTMKEVPVRLYLFDLLYVNGQSLIDQPYQERWQKLIEICDTSLLADRIIARDANTAEQFLQHAMAAGHEGLMAKDLTSIYQPGSRGKKWFKIKPAETLDLAIVAAEWGYGRRTGWLSNYHLAVRDSGTGEFLMIGKTFKGLTDAQFKWMTETLQQLKTSENRSTVFVRPQIVVEVAYNEIQRSPQYKSKFALRFARIKRIREDKSSDQIDTMERLLQLYERQFERKGESRKDQESDQ